MDINSINPAAHADQEEFPIGGGSFLHLPAIAKGQSVTAAARRLAKGLDLGEGVVLAVPEDEAMAIAAAVVDPSALRLDLERKRVSFHRTPSGHQLVSAQARVWAAAVSADGANGRAVFDAKFNGDPVWPVPQPGSGEPTMRYVARIDTMREAVREFAKSISSPDMRMHLREHPDGVWNPVYVVPARAIVPGADGEIESEGTFLHAAEGSTRIVTCQEGVGLARDLPVEFAGDTLQLVRRARAGIAGRLVQQPGSADAHHAVKVATLPANIIIGVLAPGTGLRSTTPFPHVVAKFVESIHEEPRPWNRLAQGAVRGERMVVRLADEGHLTEEQAADVIGRDEFHVATAPVNVIAGRLLRVTTTPATRDIVRHAILEDPARERLTPRRWSETMGPLLLPLYRSTPAFQKNAVAALNSIFLPPALRGGNWEIHAARTTRDLLGGALSHLETAPETLSDDARELAARSLGAVAALGLVFSEQGSQFPDPADGWKRGPFASVITGLMLCAGGLHVLCEAAERVENPSSPMPVLRTPAGTVVLGEDGQPLHLHPEQRANVLLRELAFRAERPTGEDEDESTQESAHDRFLAAQRRAVATVAELRRVVEVELFEINGEDGRPLIDKDGLDRSIMGELPRVLGDIRDLVLLSLAEEETGLVGDDDDPETEYDELAKALVAEDEDGLLDAA